MKKIALLVSAAMLLTTAAFADDGGKASLQWSLWGRTVWAPIMSNSVGDPTTTMGVGWGNATRNTLFVKGDAGNIGFDLTLGYDNGSLAQSWNDGPIDVWAKPFDGLKISTGYLEDYTLRGEADYGDWDWIRTIGVGDDAIFQGVGTVEGGAAGPISTEVSYAVGPLYVYYDQAYTENSANSLSPTTTAFYDYLEAFKNASYGLGYTIPGVGQIRIQNVGYDRASWGWAGYATNGRSAPYGFGMFQAAFKLTGIKDLYVDIGYWVPTAFLDNANGALAGGFDWRIPLFATYQMGKLKVSFNADLMSVNKGAWYYGNAMTSSGLTNDGSSQIGWLAGIGLDYALGGGLGLTGDFKMDNRFDSLNTSLGAGNVNAQATAMIGITKSLASGDIGMGFEWLNGGPFAMGNSSASTQNSTNPQNNWAIPVRIDYWF